MRYRRVDIPLANTHPKIEKRSSTFTQLGVVPPRSVTLSLVLRPLLRQMSESMTTYSSPAFPTTTLDTTRDYPPLRAARARFGNCPNGSGLPAGLSGL